MVPQTPETESTRSVNFLASAMPAEETLSELADLFHVLGDLTRIRILCALSISELRVSEIAELLSMSSSAISHQLRVLRQARLVRLTRNLDSRPLITSLKVKHPAQHKFVFVSPKLSRPAAFAPDIRRIRSNRACPRALAVFCCQSAIATGFIAAKQVYSLGVAGNLVFCMQFSYLLKKPRILDVSLHSGQPLIFASSHIF